MSGTGGADKDLETIRYLRSARAIRERSTRILAAVEAGEGRHFSYHPDRLDAVSDKVLEVTRRSYPDLDIPYHSRWRHFQVGGVDRISRFLAMAKDDPAERGRASFELAIVSVLLDAGAGMAWSFVEDGRSYSKSEGLAVASFAMFESGAFSSDEKRPLRADAAGLEKLSIQTLERGFQVSAENPLVGSEGRLSLLHTLGEAVRTRPEWFGETDPRVGGLFDSLAASAKDGRLCASRILEALLDALGSIWPGRLVVSGVNLGDVWPHPAVNSLDPAPGLVPFHKLSQWLAYSLVEPLEQSGITVTDLDELTGLPEYRNGGLFLDMGLLTPLDPGALSEPKEPGGEWVVEWRACTVALLDRVASRVRERLNLSAESLPLAKVLQGGTWTAGREVARELRSDGGPPFPIVSDGTVF